MELGFDFDDSDFAEKVREKQILTSYNAKVCYNEVMAYTYCTCQLSIKV